jgi:hypothetical protein
LLSELLNPNPHFENEQLKLTQNIQNEDNTKLNKELSVNELMSKNKNYNINNDNDNEMLNQQRKSINIGEVNNLALENEEKEKKIQRKRNIKIHTIKKKKNKKKKKVNKSQSSEKESKEKVPYSDFNLINNVQTVPEPEKKEEPKKEIIRSKFDYERYKQEKRKQYELERKSKNIIFAALKKEEDKRVNMRKNSVLFELFTSDNNIEHKDEYNISKKFEKIKKKEGKEYADVDEEHSLINELRKIKEKEEEEELDDDYPSEDVEGLEEIDLTKDIENNGDIVKKKWMENSPKFKNKIIDINNRRRYAITNDSQKLFDILIKE